MDGQDNRRKILECALNLFAARGYDAVGIQEIVEAAGITKPTLYHYFGNKHGLLESLLVEHFNEFYQAVAQASEYKQNLLMTIRAVVKTHFDFAQTHPTFYRLQLALWFAPPDSEPHKIIIGLVQRQYALIEKFFSEAVNEHGNMRGRQRAYAATFLGMINTYVGLYLNGYSELNDAVVLQAAHQFMHGIFS